MLRRLLCCRFPVYIEGIADSTVRQSRQRRLPGFAAADGHRGRAAVVHGHGCEHGATGRSSQQQLSTAATRASGRSRGGRGRAQAGGGTAVAVPSCLAARQAEAVRQQQAGQGPAPSGHPQQRPQTAASRYFSSPFGFQVIDSSAPSPGLPTSVFMQM